METRMSKEVAARVILKVEPKPRLRETFRYCISESPLDSLVVGLDEKAFLVGPL